MIIVLDTNVLFSALVSNGLCAEVFRIAVKERAIASSVALLAELEELVERKLTLTPATRLFLSGLRRHALLVEPALLPKPVCRDSDDDLVLATALSAKADAIVTGDDDLLVLKSFQGIPILLPRQFLSGLQ